MKILSFIALITVFLGTTGPSAWAAVDKTASSSASNEVLSTEILAKKAAQIRQELATESAQVKTTVLKGKIASISGQSIILNTPQGNKTIVAESQTKFIRTGSSSRLAAFSSLKPGNTIIALGQLDIAETLTAKVIMIAPEKNYLTRQIFQGSVDSLDKNMFNLNVFRDSSLMPIKVTPQSQISFKNRIFKKTPTIEDLHTGDKLIVLADSKNKDATLSASLIHVVLSQIKTESPLASPAAVPGSQKK